MRTQRGTVQKQLHFMQKKKVALEAERLRMKIPLKALLTLLERVRFLLAIKLVPSPRRLKRKNRRALVQTGLMMTRKHAVALKKGITVAVGKGSRMLIMRMLNLLGLLPHPEKETGSSSLEVHIFFFLCASLYEK
jgi:hypothetical protein